MPHLPDKPVAATPAPAGPATAENSYEYNKLSDADTLCIDRSQT